jgi:5-hydroxyisourate hydrolase-like protein (transthyretin family)
MTGQPAASLEIKLYKHNQGHDDDWELVSRGHTDSDGYLDSLIFHTNILPIGIYKLEYMLQEYYFDKRKIKTTYPMVQPTFEIKDGMVQYHFRVTVAPHFHQVYLDTEVGNVNEITESTGPHVHNMNEVIHVEVAVTG